MLLGGRLSPPSLSPVQVEGGVVREWTQPQPSIIRNYLLLPCASSNELNPLPWRTPARSVILLGHPFLVSDCPRLLSGERDGEPPMYVH